MAEQEKFVYACKSASGFTFRVDATRYTFVKHQLIIEDAEEAETVDAFLKKYPLIGNKVKRVSLEAAEALVKNHVATHGGAKSGPFSSVSSGQHEATKIAERDAALANMSEDNKKTLADKLAADSLLTTEKTDVAPVVETKTKPAVNTLAGLGIKKAN